MVITVDQPVDVERRAVRLAEDRFSKETNEGFSSGLKGIVGRANAAIAASVLRSSRDTKVGVGVLVEMTAAIFDA